MDYIYNINNVLKKNLENVVIPRGREIFICMYEILFKINSTRENPFLQFLMYKYQKEENMDEIFCLPFFKYNGGNILNETKKRVVNIAGKNIKFDGYLMFENNLFLFFGEENINFTFKKLQSNNKYWWCLIDEICNKKKVLNYELHDKATRLFLSNRDLIYLYDEDGSKLEIPTVCYKGDHIETLAYTASFGQRRSTRSRFGPFYTLGTFNWAIRWAGWSKNYQKHFFQGNAITDDNGKYKRGGVIRIAVFLGDLEIRHIIMNRKDDIFKYLIDFYDTDKDRSKSEIAIHRDRVEKETGKWSTNYKSLVIPKIKNNNNSGYFNANTEYIISDSNDKLTLSLHEMDINSLNVNWDPFSENYRIL